MSKRIKLASKTYKSEISSVIGTGSCVRGRISLNVQNVGDIHSGEVGSLQHGAYLHPHIEIARGNQLQYDGEVVGCAG